jgi:hypothetical protein
MNNLTDEKFKNLTDEEFENFKKYILKQLYEDEKSIIQSIPHEQASLDDYRKKMNELETKYNDIDIKNDNNFKNFLEEKLTYFNESLTNKERNLNNEEQKLNDTNLNKIKEYLYDTVAILNNDKDKNMKQQNNILEYFKPKDFIEKTKDNIERNIYEKTKSNVFKMKYQYIEKIRELENEEKKLNTNIIHLNQSIEELKKKIHNIELIKLRIEDKEQNENENEKGDEKKGGKSKTHRNIKNKKSIKNYRKSKNRRNIKHKKSIKKYRKSKSRCNSV